MFIFLDITQKAKFCFVAYCRPFAVPQIFTPFIKLKQELLRPAVCCATKKYTNLKKGYVELL